MAKSKFIHVKQKDKNAPVRLAIYALLTLGALMCVFAPDLLPQLRDSNSGILTVMRVLGIAALAYFAFMLAYTVMRMVSPKDAMIVCRSGYYDFVTSPGKNLFVSWKSISSARIFRIKNDHVLGIYLSNPDKLTSGLDDELTDEIKANLEIGLPPLMYRESEIKEPLQRVLTLFMKRIETADAVDYDEAADSEYSIPEIDESN